eukprot:CAMPEP_0172624150 /NCGR_PEP_ID=MMETSP1068-20121228/134186_1 /TAXON_ID=35684 /ORGANISM="Pseudopedinella elastica, Strain CCMP716" /LENGTH=138 /DNA_ID=CAMNT_0013432975 /DNA_START=15 /DNA_END=428 /DNA_ORIENTATION=-
MVAKHRKDSAAPLKCSACVSGEADAEKERAVSKSDSAPDVFFECAECLKQLPGSSFNKNQLKKGKGKHRCRACVETAESASKDSSAEERKRNLAELKENARVVEVRGTPAEKAVAASRLAAAEAEYVTGLKPVVLGKG